MPGDDDALKGSSLKFFMNQFKAQGTQGDEYRPYHYMDVQGGQIKNIVMTVRYRKDINGEWQPMLTQEQSEELRAAERRLKDYNASKWRGGSWSSMMDMMKGVEIKTVKDARAGEVKRWTEAMQPKVKTQEIAKSDDFFWQLAGLFGWEGRKIEDIEVTFRLQTDKPVQITVAYKDHGKEMYNGDSETTTEFALVLEQYDLKLTDRVVEEKQKKK